MDARNERIAELLRAGHTQRQIAADLGVSGPAVAQRIRKEPELRRLRTTRSRSERGRLRAYRLELVQMRAEALRLAVDIQASIAALDEELEAADIDCLLGLRA